MKRLIHFSLLVLLTLSLSACNLGSDDEQEPAGVTVDSTLKLTIQVQNAGDIFNSVGQIIKYNYIVQNLGTSGLAGPVTINSDKMLVTCPAISTIGNLNDLLDPNESINCPSDYAITQSDLNAGNVTVNATATVGGITSPPASVTVPVSANTVLVLTTTANPTTYFQVGQIVNYSYVIKNGGSLILVGPFSISDTRMTVTCTQPANGQLAPNEQMNCASTYQITQNDITAGSVTNTSTASGGTAVSPPVNTTITYGGAGLTATPTPGSYTPGSTVQHKVQNGEWLLQIARCYGADFKTVASANPGISNLALINPGLIVSVPGIGKVGTIYGPPCVVFHTVKSGETWESIAAQYNASVTVLKEANPVTLAPGVVLKVPVNSAGATVSNPVATPPTPTFTPIAIPTATVSQAPVIQYFTTSSNSIKIGNTIVLSWSFTGQDLAKSSITRTNPDGSTTPLNNGGDVPPVGTLPDTPPTTGRFLYTLAVSSEFAGTTTRMLEVIVNP